MDLHIVNGFLGSGKTTAILSAAIEFSSRGKKVGIVTNDKGRFQVDRELFESQIIPSRQVTGGCFRCSFPEFEEQLMSLKEGESPDIIFAESVGSCVDLVNPIFPSLLRNESLKIEKITYSVFTDIRLFSRWFYQKPSPFTDHVNYLFTKQIEESQLLLINKSDLLPENDIASLHADAGNKMGNKNILMQNSLNPSDIIHWIDQLEEKNFLTFRPDFSVDYSMYKKGEREMAWLDQILTIESDFDIRGTLIKLISYILEPLIAEDVFVGHMKFILSSGKEEHKISFTTADFLQNTRNSHWEEEIPQVGNYPMKVIINGRLSMDANHFVEIITGAINRCSNETKTHIFSEEGLSYNPEMSMSHP